MPWRNTIGRWPLGRAGPMRSPTARWRKRGPIASPHLQGEQADEEKATPDEAYRRDRKRDQPAQTGEPSTRR